LTPSTISQPLNNVALASQSGGGVVAQANFAVNGGDALIGVSASAWAASGPTPISIAVWVDGQPTGGGLGLTATQGAMHLSLGHTWVWCRGLSAGQHELVLVAGGSTVTDQNDFACATVWEMGDGCVARFSDDAPSPVANGALLFKEAFETTGETQVLMSASSSGWATGPGDQVIGSNIWFGAPTESLDIFANNAEMDLASVPNDFIFTVQERGQSLVQLQASQATNTDQSDIAHLTVVEFVDAANAPVVRAHLGNVPALSQHGDGGTVVAANFSCGGGPLLVRTSSSAWTSGTNVPLQLGIQVDGTSRGFLQLFANPSTTHMALVTNDLVLTGVPAGQHTLGLIGEANTTTDQNDYVSLLIMEFPS
jgi:hypothetical protein